MSWLLTRGRPRTTKRVRLGAGFSLVLPEQPDPDRPPGIALQAEREGLQTFCWEWFELDGSGATATKLQETGTLRLGWATDRDGRQEVSSTTFVSDVSLRLTAAGASARQEPAWRVRVRAGSVVHWSRAGDGIQLVRRLRPDHPGNPRSR